jgi:hypothetical protein
MLLGLIALAALAAAGCGDATVTVLGGSPTSSSGSPASGATATATSPAPTATPNPGRYDGTWVDNVAGSNGQAGELVISNLGLTASVQGYGLCGTKCDWGSVSSAVGAFNLVAHYSFSSSESATLTMQLTSNNLKVVDADTHFGTSTYFMHQATATEARAFLYLSEWINNDPHTTSIPELYIYGSGTAFTVHGYGACTPTYCDWGTRSATYSADPLLVPFDFGGSLYDHLSLTVDSTGTTLTCVDTAGSGTYTETFHKSVVA